jgi:hypothetical protein
MARRLGGYLAREIDQLRTTARLLLLRQPSRLDEAGLKQILRDLDEIPRIYAESFTLQALGLAASRLRSIERATPPLDSGSSLPTLPAAYGSNGSAAE